MVSAEVVEYRPRFGRVLAAAVAVLGVAGLVSGFAADWRATLPYLPVIAVVVLWVWAAYWRPAVIVTPAGVELRNISRTIELPWPANERVETRYALTLHTAYGTYAAWAAPASGRSRSMAAGGDAARDLPESTYQAGTVGSGDLLVSSSGQAAAIVRSRWEELRDAGLLDDPRVERSRPTVRWHVATLVALAVLAAASVAAFTI
jgi:hypothetical protein